jgi:hypothetical protein
LAGSNLGLTQTRDFFPFCRSFFALQGEKRSTKEETYHAAAGYDRCSLPTGKERCKRLKKLV